MLRVGLGLVSVSHRCAKAELYLCVVVSGVRLS